MEYAVQRAAEMRKSATHSQALLEVDEAIHCLDYHDHSELENAQKAAYLHNCELQAFEKEFAEASARVKKGGPKAKEYPKLSKLLKLEQKEVKRFLPPGASVCILTRYIFATSSG